MKRKFSKQTILRIATALMAALVLFALGMFVRVAIVNARSKANFKELSEMVVRNTSVPVIAVIGTPASPEETVTPYLATPGSSPEDSVASVPAAPSPTPDSTAEPARTPLADYEALYARNPDFFGWITMEGTNVDYPIMYNPKKPLQYLDHDFDGNFSYAGVPFLDPECDPDGNYYLIYGHHMRDGTMFAGILAYEDKAFWEEHPTFRCDTRFERRTYAVVAAFRTRVKTQNEKGFRYYNYSALSDEETFQEFMTNVRALCAYDTGVETAFGDEILTLSTCAYHTELGRFVVVAKRVE